MPLRPSSCLILAMLVVSIACSLLHLPLWPAAILGWLATLRLSLQLPRTSRRQATWLGLAGVIIWGVALWRGTPASLVTGLSVNQPLLMMFAGAAFSPWRALSRMTIRSTNGAVASGARC